MVETSSQSGGIQKPKKKLYYSLKQTAVMLEMTPDDIKRWETHFPEIKPVRNRADNRYYTEKDVFLLLFIKDLLNEQKLSFDDARIAVDKYREELVEKENLRLKQTLAEIRMEIDEMLTVLNEPL